MKKIILPLLALLFLFACQKESTTDFFLDSEKQEEVEQNTSASERGSNKRDVCHNGNIINININAIPAHQAHGDAVDMDEDGYFDIDNPCSATDCDDNDADVNPGVEEVCDDGIDNNCNGEIDEGCQACIDCEWSNFLNSIDLANACRTSISGYEVLYSFGLNNLFCCGLAVRPDGIWTSGSDNEGQFGGGTPECYDCFIEFLDDNNIPQCSSSPVGIQENSFSVDNGNLIFY